MKASHLYVVFRLGADRYALAAAGVVEVVPYLTWKEVPGAAAGIAGLFDYRGTVTPLIDLSALALGRASRALMSTRIVVVNYVDDATPPSVDAAVPAGGSSSAAPAVQRLGLLAEEALGTLRAAAGDFSDGGVSAERAPYLGAVLHDAGGLVQLIDVSLMLTIEVKAQLFRALDAQSRKTANAAKSNSQTQPQDAPQNGSQGGPR